MLAGVLLLAACARTQPEPAPEPEPPAPAPAAMVSPRAVAGTYQLRAMLQRGRPQRGQPAATLLRLDPQPTAAPLMGAPAGAQFAAVINVPGYTRAPRGRAGQAAAWWPIPGDSVIVQFEGAQRGAQVQLRGAVGRDGITGEVWYLSLETGSTFQLGTFTARRPPARGARGR
jgi:hypothetical protein